MARLRLVSMVFACTSAVPAVALAQSSPSCPPGAWFCADAPGVSTADTPAPASPPGAAEAPARRKRVAPTAAPAPEADEDADAEPAPPATVYVPAHPTQGTPPPVIVYQPAPKPAPPAVVYVTPPATRVVEPPPPPPPPRSRSEWGAAFRLQGVMMGSHRSSQSMMNGSGANDNGNNATGMGGIGFSLRPRPSPHFALDLGIDGFWGTDYNGEKRTEGSFTINPMLFLNPRSSVQVYLLAGVGFANANVQHADQTRDHYGYFGIDGGAGLEFRLTRAVALDVDVVGFVRDRTDRGADARPEYVDPNNSARTTNTSGGGLFRAGLAFYW